MTDVMYDEVCDKCEGTVNVIKETGGHASVSKICINCGWFIETLSKEGTKTLKEVNETRKYLELPTISKLGEPLLPPLEIMLADLKKGPQVAVLSCMGLKNAKDGNLDVVPIFTIEHVQ